MRRRNVLGILSSAGAAIMAGAATYRNSVRAATLENLASEQQAAQKQLAAMRPKESRRGDMLYRTLGRTRESVSVIGIGGSHLGDTGSEAEATRILHAAIDHGITFMDNSWDYHEGRSERWMGNALADGRRGDVFLMTKFDGRTKKAAQEQLDDSLKRLRTDHIDLWQFHENIRMEDADRFFGEDGAVETVRDALKAGKVRFVGFTGHKDPSIHLRMLDEAKKHDFHFDTCQMPVNVMDYHFRSFTHQVLPRLLEEGIAVLGMKPIGSGALLRSGVVTAPECLRWALSQPVSVVITGVDGMDKLTQALDLVKSFRPMNEHEAEALLARTRTAALTGKFEPFKTSTGFDATAQHPEWLG